MATGLASHYTAQSKRALTSRVGLRADTLPQGGNFHPEEDVLALLLDHIDQHRPRTIVQLGGSMAAPLMALAAGPDVDLTVVESCGRTARITRRMLQASGAEAAVLETELQPYDKHNLWYARSVTGQLPHRIDLLFIDGPGHFAGRMPRWAAGPELFSRLAPSGTVVLDDGRRVKEKKTLKSWAEEFPDLCQTATKTSSGAVVLRRP
ncbi:MAG: hypothetical protein AAGB15_04530 [Pseudomonadota bacterium]